MPFAPFIGEKTEKSKSDNFNKKTRFITTENKDYQCDTPGFWKYEKKWDVVDDETKLITPGVGTKHKTQIELTNTMHPNNYEVPVQNKLQKENEEKIYFPGYDTGPGKGFGNMSISNDIRFGDFTRSQTKNYKQKKETEVIDRWQYIDNRFQKSDNLIMPIPRGGEGTRKSNSDPFVIRPVEKEFEFKY